jgi:hypothetical protein
MQQVGRVEFECHKPPPMPICGRCVQLERAIRKYLMGYTSRRASEEGKALAELSRVIGYSDIVGEG